MGMRTFMHAFALLITAVVCVGAAGCASPMIHDVVRDHPDCASLESDLMGLIHSGALSDEVSAALAGLPDECATERENVISYLGVTAEALDPSAARCEAGDGVPSWQAGLEWAAQGGECPEVETDAPSPSTWPDGGTGWNQAISLVGTTERLCGPLMSLRNTGWGAFLNLGEDYPSPDRFAVVIWDLSLDPIVEGSVICVEGYVTMHEGVAQMEVRSPEEIEIWPTVGGG